MADPLFHNRFCLEFYETSQCSRNGCKYVHRRSDHVEVVTVRYDQGYIEGRSYAPLCRYHLRGSCKFGTHCRFRHVELIDAHRQPPDQSISNHQQHQAGTSQYSSPLSNIEMIFIQSKQKICGICLETVMEKAQDEQRFGILPNCTHCYCIKCISKWRKSRQFDNEIIRACPECRVQSDFVCPSRYWVETKDDKDKLIDDYKKALAQRDCKYFRKGSGHCPFGNKCFYRHAYPDGRICDVGPPRRRQRRIPINATTANGTATTDPLEMLHHVLLLDILEDSRQWDIFDELEELSYPNDTSDSEYSDLEY